MKTLCALLSLLFVCASVHAADPYPPAPPEAVQKWRDARFGMFIHWGPVSLKGTEIGWSRGAPIPIEEYDSLYKKFNPTEFNADEWVAVAKAAGMKYMVLTTKHHDGFCLWDTKQTDYNIMNSPFGRDVVKELSEACKKGGIAFGTYYSTCDWHHPSFPQGSPGGSTKKPHPDIKAYDAYLQAQVKELITNYGPLFTLWFDVPQSYSAEYGIPMVRRLRELQPDLIINNRAYNPGAGGHGVSHHNAVADYDTPEQTIGGFRTERPWETCMTICQQWAWKPNDKMKSLKECIHTLLKTNGGDGNLLFNVGPMPDGRIEPRQVERLKEMGEWLKVNGEAVFATRGGPYMPGAGIVSTRKGDKIFLHVLDWPENRLVLPELPGKVLGARLLRGGSAKVVSGEDGMEVVVSPVARDPIATVIELTMDRSAMEMTPMPASATGLLHPGLKTIASAVYGPGYEPAKALDGDPGTRWATPAGTREAAFEVHLAKPTIFSAVEIVEATEGNMGERVKSFELEALVEGEWKSLGKGTTIGKAYRHPLPEPLSASAIRLRILEASEGPTISEIRLLRPARKTP